MNLLGDFLELIDLAVFLPCQNLWDSNVNRGNILYSWLIGHCQSVESSSIYSKLTWPRVFHSRLIHKEPVSRAGLRGSLFFCLHCTPHIHPLTEWTMPTLAFSAEAGTHCGGGGASISMKCGKNIHMWAWFTEKVFKVKGEGHKCTTVWML